MNFKYLLFFFLSHMLISINVNPTFLPTHICYDTGNFTADSTYGRNRGLILSSLSSKATRGFYNASFGQEPDKVYALALCSGGISSEECFNCVNFTSQEIMTMCPNQKEAFMWGSPGGDFPRGAPGPNPFFVRYSDSSFWGKLEVNPKLRANNRDNVAVDLEEFDRIWENLVDGLVQKASKGTSRIKFVTAEANMTDFQQIYALMECTPDLSESKCHSCLTQNVAEYQNCCNGKKGIVVRGPNCMFRWEFYAFYNSTADPPSPSPAPLPATATSTIPQDNGGDTSSPPVVIIVVSIIVFLVVLVALAYVILRKWKANKDIGSKQGRNYIDEIDSAESLQFDFSTIKAATNDFPAGNKLGQGGFGAVYKGKLPNGQDIAVKRLSSNSGQGEIEFKMRFS